MDLGRRENGPFNYDVDICGFPVQVGLDVIWQSVCLEFLVIGHSMKTDMMWLDVTTGTVGGWKAIILGECSHRYYQKLDDFISTACHPVWW